MSRYGITVQFSCKMCKGYFEIVEDYIEHKRENHFAEFEKTKCFIILEERTLSVEKEEVDLDGDGDGVVANPSPPSITIDEERNDPDPGDYHIDKIDSSLRRRKRGGVRIRTRLPSKEDPRVIKSESQNYQQNYNEAEAAILPVSVTHNFTETSIDHLTNSSQPTYLIPTKCEQILYEDPTTQQEQAEPILQNQHSLKNNTVLVSQLSPAQLDSHVNFECGSCHQSFNSERELQNHGSICRLLKNYPDSYCTVCNKIFMSPLHLQEHEFTFHRHLTLNVNENYPEPEFEDENDDEPEFILADESPSPMPMPMPIPTPMRTVFRDDDQGTSQIKKRKRHKNPYYELLTPTPHEIHQGGKNFEKPNLPCVSLIFLALKNSKNGSLRAPQIYKFFSYHFPYFQSAPVSWKNALRHNLSHYKVFGRIENLNCKGVQKNCRWAVDPSAIQKLDEQLQSILDLQDNLDAFRRSMRDPENMELILRGEFKRECKDSDDDEEDEDLTVITFRPQGRRSRRSADPFPNETVSSGSSTNAQVSQQRHPSLARATQPKIIKIKSEPISTNLNFDFGQITSVRGNYSA